jgi:hypothetical protein
MNKTYPEQAFVEITDYFLEGDQSNARDLAQPEGCTCGACSICLLGSKQSNKDDPTGSSPSGPPTGG